MKVEVAVVGSQPSLIVRTISLGVINTEPELAQWTVVPDFTQKRVADIDTMSTRLLKTGVSLGALLKLQACIYVRPHPTNCPYIVFE